MRKKKEKKNRLMNSPWPKFDTDIDLLKRQVTVETYRSSGPGGQRKNKTETAVRLKHLPSGITVIATEHRSQAQNLNLAFERLRERLLRLSRPKKRRVPTRVPRKAKEARIEEKKSRSTKKRFRQKPQGEFE
jgi:protein subunit release factor B